MTYHGTTILAVIRDGKLAFGGDGQVTLGDQIIKARAQKIRRLSSHPIIGGFAGATADAFTLFERFENKLDSMSGNMTRAAVELARDWRMDKALRQLQAMLLVGNSEKILVLSGQGDVLEPDEPVAAIGSGAPAALAAAKAMLRHTDLSAAEIVKCTDHRLRTMHLHQRQDYCGGYAVLSKEAINLPGPELTPQETVAELDRYVVGQHKAKRAVAIALRNRYTCRQLQNSLRERYQTKNLLLIGPTGVSKTRSPAASPASPIFHSSKSKPQIH